MNHFVFGITDEDTGSGEVVEMPYQPSLEPVLGGYGPKFLQRLNMAIANRDYGRHRKFKVRGLNLYHYVVGTADAPGYKVDIMADARKGASVVDKGRYVALVKLALLGNNYGFEPTIK